RGRDRGTPISSPDMDLDNIDEAALRARRGAKWANCPDDVLAAWVADMDFPIAAPIVRALMEMASASDVGYPSGTDARRLAGIFAARMKQRFDWAVDPARVEVLTDVVQGLHIAVSLFSEVGDGVITPTPIYPPFLEAVRSRVPVWQRLVLTPCGYRVDVERLRADLTPNTRMLLVCNPHNPTGHVLGIDELEALAAIALERDLVVVSDEIHADLVYSGARHVPMATLGTDIAARTITLTSATKAFNIAGLRCAVAVFGSALLQRRFHDVHPHALGGLGAPGLAATAAAWTDGQDWQDEVVRYLEGNRDIVTSHADIRWPQVLHRAPEATYLAWLDCTALPMNPTPQRVLLERARVWLSPGEDFGIGGEGFVRLNFATSRPLLRCILERMDQVLAG
ncbi:MAG: MalY/PatB family protein, partial [Candidatus Binatia bacterium]